jgi:hypothetical protein
LFTRLLEARERSPLERIPQRSLIRFVLHLWLIDDTIVLTPQARRCTHAPATAQTESGLNLATGAASLYWITQMSALLHPHTKLTEPPRGGKQPLIAGTNRPQRPGARAGTAPAAAPRTMRSKSDQSLSARSCQEPHAQGCRRHDAGDVTARAITRDDDPDRSGSRVTPP